MSLLFLQYIIFASIIFIAKQRKLNSMPQYLSSNIIKDITELLFLLPEGKIITFNDSLINITLYNTSDEYFNYDKMNINFENCLTILQEEYDLDPFFDYNNNDNNEIYKRCFFVIVKIELDRKIIIINNNTNNELMNNNYTKYPTNHIEYLVFNGKNGKLLNTSYCNDLNVKISHPIVDQNGINFNMSKKLYEKFKIDVYRKNDTFFNDFCMNYTSDKKTDLTISQRRKIYYQNVSFCDSNCTYVEVNYTSNTAICVCEVKDGIMNDVLLEGGDIQQNSDSFAYEDKVSIINYKIFQCYKEVFDTNRLIRNVGNYFSLAIIVLYTFCIIHFCKNRKREAMFFFHKMKIKFGEDEKKNESKKNNENENKSNIGNDSNGDEEHKNNKRNKNKSININGIIITDISNPPHPKKKSKITKNNEENKDGNIYKIKKNEYIIKPNDNITKDTNTLIHNYGDIKIDTGDELISKKNEEKNWGEIIGIKRKSLKKNNETKKIQLTSGNNSSMVSSTKNNTIKSNDKKFDNNSLTKTITQNNIENYNYINLFHTSNYSVEIPISKIIPCFLKPKSSLINNLKSPNNSKYNSKDLITSQNSQNNLIIKKNKIKCNNSIYNNFINKNDAKSEKENSNNGVENKENNNCEEINNINKINLSLKRLRETISKKRTKNKGNFRENIKNYEKNNLFLDFDVMKFEIAILIDNRDFCEKFLCEIKDNCIIIILFFREDIMFKQVKLSSFILSCTLDYFFNAFLFSDLYLEKRYDEDKLISILIDYPKEIFSCLASQFIVKLIDLLLEDKALSLFIKRIASQNKDYLKGVNYLLRKYEKKFLIYISIGYLILAITWYYTCAFCTVYQNSQMILLYDTLQSCVINIIIPFPIAFLSMSFRHLAIKKLNKFCFFISNILRIFT